MTTCWAILTGEYPPQPGGVADYTRQVALGLASAGDEVHIFAPRQTFGKELDNPNLNLVRLSDHFGPRGLVELHRALGRLKVDRLLIQYVPHAYGWKAMNVAFALWVAVRAQRFAPVWVMFHEVAFPIRRPLSHAVLGVINRLMARLVAGAAERVFSSITAWEPLIQRICPGVKPIEWLPVPSNITDDPAIAAIRTTTATSIGHFGTYGQTTVKLLEPTLICLLERHDRSVVLLGRGSVGFRDQFTAHNPHLAGRLIALGELQQDELAAHLRGCDVLLQPYIDGISSRRGSTMAVLANGIPLVSNLGPLSEPFWANLGCICLASSPSPEALSAATERVLSMNPTARAAMGREAVMLYRDNFGLENTIARLRNPERRNSA